MLVHNSKLKLQLEFKQFEKNIETQKRVALAKAESASRTKLMHERERIVQTVKNETLSKLEAFAGAPDKKDEYKEVLKQLIVQGLIKLNEKKVKVICKQGDVSLVEDAKEAAGEEYCALIKEATGENVKVSVAVEGSDKIISGGVKLIAHQGRLVCDNTLQSRVEIAFQQRMPELRKTLFTTKV